MPRKLKFNVNVGNVNNTSYLGHNTGDDVYERGDHFAVCFYHTDTNTLVYGDFLSIYIPDDVIILFTNLLRMVCDNDVATPLTANGKALGMDYQMLVKRFYSYWKVRF